MSISFSISNEVRSSEPKKETAPAKNSSAEKPLPNPIATRSNSAASAAASSAVSFKATQLPKSSSTNNGSIQTVPLRLGNQKPLILLSVKTLEKFKNHCSPEGYQAMADMNKIDPDRFQTLLAAFPEGEVIKYSDEKYFQHPEVAKIVSALVLKILPKPHEKVSILEKPTALVLESLPEPQEDTANGSTFSTEPLSIKTNYVCKKLRKEISLEDDPAYKQVYFAQELRFPDGTTLMLSAETMKILFQNCSAEGFKKLCQGNLNINVVFFLRILSDLKCEEDIKNFASSFDLLDLNKYRTLVEVADLIGTTKLVGKYKKEMPEILNLPVFTSIKTRILQLPISHKALDKLCQMSPVAREKMNQEEFELPRDFIFRLLMNDMGCFDTNMPTDLQIKIELMRFRDINEQLLPLIEITSNWGIDSFKEKYIQMLRKTVLDLLRDMSLDINASYLNEMDNLSALLQFLSIYSNIDQQLQSEFDRFFGLLLCELISNDNRFAQLIDKLKNLSINKLYFLKSNLEDTHLLLLARIENLKELDIQGCKRLTGVGLKDFKEELGLRKVQILCDKDLEDAFIKVNESEALVLPPTEVTFKDGVSISSNFIELLEKTTDFDNIYEALTNNIIEDLGISSQDFQRILRDIEMGVSNPEDVNMSLIEAAKILSLDSLVEKYKALSKA